MHQDTKRSVSIAPAAKRYQSKDLPRLSSPVDDQQRVAFGRNIRKNSVDRRIEK